MSKTLLNFVANNYFKYMLCKKFLAMAFVVASFVLVGPNISHAASLSSVTIASGNASTTLAKIGDKITISFTSSAGLGIATSTINGNTATVASTSATSFKATYTLTGLDTTGVITFKIGTKDLSGVYGFETSTTTNKSKVTYNPAPTITSVIPYYILSSGGNSVTVTGTGFLSSPTVKFDYTAGTGVLVPNSTTISVNSPVHALGIADVVVINADGQAATSSSAVRFDGVLCDSGDLEHTCTISTSHTMANGTTITGPGNLVIANGGSLTSAAENKFGINMGGDITVQSGGSILGNLSGATSTNFT
ncbi:MAG: IPT/TIG domain-containing protein, partial [bacterium]